MANAVWHVTMSLDGFIAGRDDSMDWAVARWSEDGANTRDIDVQRSTLADDVLQNAGAILGGRRWYDAAVAKFDGYNGIYGGQWAGPVFVLTHRPPDDRPHAAVTFLSGTVEAALARAAAAAAGRNVIVFGANLAQQCLRAGLLDEVVIHLVPVLLGEGVRLVDMPGVTPVVLERLEIGTSGQITDLRFGVRPNSPPGPAPG